jgi:serine phosphatase RsbU (regulator of sigma subunit)
LDRARGEGQRDRTDPATTAEEQALAGLEQTLADSDQPGEEGPARERSTRRRDDITGARLNAGDRRDAIAGDRDLAARVRDDDAAVRDDAMAELDATIAARDDARDESGADAIIHAAGKRRRAAERRAQAAAYRELAASDRHAAARDRERAARERRDALGDREELAAELQHERDQRRKAVRRQHRAEELAATLQRGLTPPSLPDIPGLDVAVHHEPFELAKVSGDFYDLFALPGDGAGFFLGDVCGKGPRAAALTSLARYTMRTAAMLHETPAAVLGDLNAALCMEGAEPTSTCTAVYGQIVMSTPTASLTLAVGGHPAPLVVRAAGGVEMTSARGTLLGAVRQPVFETCEVRLDAGDALVIYSDGILDNAVDGVPVDERRIMAVLSGALHASAADLVDRLMRSMRRIDRTPRDDVAFMALRHVGPTAAPS